MRQGVKWAIIAAITAAVAALSIVGAAVAQDKSAVLKQRQDLMKGQGADLKPIQAFAKGEGDQNTALTAANDLVSRSGRIPDLFPPGTSSTDFPGKTNAKPDIWQNWDKFKGYATTTHSEELKLVDAIKNNDRKAAGDEIGAIGKAGCGSCHGTFREKMS